MDYKSIAPWELLQKKMVWEHLKFIRNKRVLDFGSGTGMTANHFAKKVMMLVEEGVRCI
jgi:cyclopropane fatty-acyl-phospholipid synthase-like methyltransferase